MLACRTTEAARDFAESANTDTLQAINDTNYLGEAVKWNSSVQDVYLVLDTRRFSQFTVEKFHNEVWINGMQTGAAHGNLSTKITMTIIDSVGISFTNYLQWLLDTKMQCGFDGMIFMLRVLFVGHNEDGSGTEIVQTVTIPMHLFKMDVNLDYAKGIYECEFMPNFNFGINVHDRWVNIGTAANYKTKSAPLLGEMVQNFQDALNAKSKDFYHDISTAAVAGGVTTQSNGSGKFGRIVQYMITLPKEWKEFKWTGVSLDNAIERTFPKKTDEAKKTEQAAAADPGTAATPATNAFTSVNPGQTIPQVLDLMFAQVDEIKALANADKLNGGKTITFYKHLVSISSNNDSFTVHVDVIPFVVPNVKPQKANTTQSTDTSIKEQYSAFTTRGGSEWVPKDYFEMEYIFTGKNLDILHFDMKIQNIQTLLASNVRASEGRLFGDSLGDGQKDVIKDPKGASNNNTGPHASLASRESFNTRPYDPILIPMMTEEQRAGFAQYVSARKESDQNKLVENSLAYSQNLSTFYARSPVHINIKIKGNPFIFEKFALQEPVPHASPVTIANGNVSNSDPNVEGDYRKRLETEILKLNGLTEGATKGTFAVKPIGMQSYVAGPVFVKVAIKGPNVDPRTQEMSQELDGNQSFATEVVSNNFYRVMKVINSIEHGVFTQELEMYSNNMFGDKP
jgi:hypothetical protein